MADVKDFLNPSAALTPGIAGGLAIAISLPLAANFDMKVKWITLPVCFLLGAVIVLSFKDPLSRLLKCVYWILDSLIIFAAAVGVGVNLDPPPAPPSAAPSQIQKLLEQVQGHAASQLGVSMAFAKGATEPGPPRSTPKTVTPQPVEQPKGGSPAKPLTKEEVDALRKYLQQQQDYQKKQQQYQKRWSW